MDTCQRCIDTHRMATGQPNGDTHSAAHGAVGVRARNADVRFASESEPEGKRTQDRRETRHQDQLRSMAPAKSRSSVVAECSLSRRSTGC